MAGMLCTRHRTPLENTNLDFQRLGWPRGAKNLSTSDLRHRHLRLSLATITATTVLRTRPADTHHFNLKTTMARFPSATVYGNEESPRSLSSLLKLHTRARGRHASHAAPNPRPRLHAMADACAAPENVTPNLRNRKAI